jgi:hypothetical protein
MDNDVKFKAELIARLHLADLTKREIAKQMEMTYAGIDRIMRTDEYKTIEQQIKAGMIEKLDGRLEKRMALKREVEDAVPEAIRVLLDHLRTKRDLKAALEILDRDPHHILGKVSRPTLQQASNPHISSEAMAKAVKDAELTHKLMQAAPVLENQKPGEA